ncbi:hypothetical protein KC678_03025 [Candidatus Dojkabacteria bacterium]|uniref:Uncharacterized protein n=1 Tax=Candidatus Dojkabacteria bacterium TaxID=2099670 RepID=A0A955L1B5_9BACT|nr:hypothetical protein [Candidatus Dojkabacteria bacterium]
MAQQQLNKTKKAYVTLVSVIILGFVAIMIISASLLIGTDSLVTSKVILDAKDAEGIANACAESALSTIRENTSYVGSQNILIGEGECSYVVTDIDANTPPNKQIQITSTVSNIIKKQEVQTSQINPTIQIASWNQDATF